MGELKDRIREAAALIGGPKALAAATGIPRRSLGNWLAGMQPKPDALRQIAGATGVRIEWLTTGDGPSAADEAVGRALRALDKQGQSERAEAERGKEEFEASFSRGLNKLRREDEAESRTGQEFILPTLGSHIISLPRYDVRASAGAGALVASEDVSEYFAVGREWLRRTLPSWAPPNAEVGVLEGSGDSMEPTVRDGDLLMVVRGVGWQIVERGGIFVFTLDDRLLLKRLQVLDNGDLLIISDNKVYEPMKVRFDDIPNRLILHGMVFFAGGRPRAAR